ncbi:MAG: hypothetical protein CL840_13235 [Crocinitomicaceae bacterium]|nr:hypothetical protein [Crocinitomicaceae bacterium]|tara:strand:- start:12788 stop:13300 length:513 start_codon:yes stop_codon:yes gene_type:complete
MAVSILITGPECSGKSSITQLLSSQLSSTVVDEYARSYLNNLANEYQQTDLEKIIQGQYKLEREALQSGSDYVILDTGPVVLCIWSLVKYSAVSPFLMNWLNQAQYDHVFLCKPDFPWKYDPLREHSQQREELFQRYEQKLQELNWKYTVLEDGPEKRKETVLKTIKFIP